MPTARTSPIPMKGSGDQRECGPFQPHESDTKSNTPKTEVGDVFLRSDPVAPPRRRPNQEPDRGPHARGPISVPCPPPFQSRRTPGHAGTQHQPWPRMQGCASGEAHPSPNNSGCNSASGPSASAISRHHWMRTNNTPSRFRTDIRRRCPRKSASCVPPSPSHW